MKNSNIKPRLVFIVTVILFGAFMRLIPHWPNFTPIAAMALFGGAYLGRRFLAYAIPILALLLSDMIIGFHDSMLAVYMAFAITVTIGLLISQKVSAGKVLLASVSSSVIFFMITNFASWMGNPIYPQNFIGLAEAYVAGLVFFNDGSYGISFFMNELLGGLFYNTIFFGAFYFARLRFPVLVRA
ncbi:MAG: DUF6580 family putative transport protein [Bacteroidota bacterium]|nr:DUF6580 family putative transport protein [Bacteroidota bacterium]